jgi:hypothetical protein
MRHLTATICLTFALFILSACGDYEKGADAYKAGDHATALSVFQPLAENKGFLSLFYSEEDVINAQSNLGVMYDKGRGVTQDDKTAVKWWTLAADQGNAIAQSGLGVMYDKGRGVTQDDKTAVKWYRLAANQGNAQSQSNLGNMYDAGRGVPKDYKTAVKWYRLAAKQGYADAQYNLGVMYGLGTGVIQDNVYAHMWFDIAASSGKSKNASKNRNIVAKRMTPSQLETAQKLARECVRKKYKGC